MVFDIYVVVFTKYLYSHVCSQFVLFSFAFVLGLLLDGGSGYNVIYCSTPQECQEYKLCNAYNNYYDTHISTSYQPARDIPKQRIFC